MIESIIKPKKTDVPGWEMVERGMNISVYESQGWFNRTYGLFVISALEVPATEPGSEVLGPEWHLSISKYPNKRCSRHEAKQVLKDFGMEYATEDNHIPGGFVRNYWLPVADKFVGYECPCVDNEPAMVEDKGDFVWRGVSR